MVCYEHAEKGMLHRNTLACRGCGDKVPRIVILVIERG
jgi:hypothetical protein